ncbi:MAG: hypothetical protein ACQEXJ_13605 [Myxococcota bacterium]
MGGSARYRFRPERLSSDELSFDVTCQFVHDGEAVGPLEVLDVSPTGLGIQPDGETWLAPGSLIENLQIFYRGTPVWLGTGVVVYQVESPRPRLGICFTYGMFDLQRLRLSDALVEQKLEQRLSAQERFDAALPPEWRASVAALGQLLRHVRAVLEDAEDGRRRGDPSMQIRDERTLIDLVFRKWIPRFHDRLQHLHRLSDDLPADAVEMARSYAERELMPLLHSCPMHGRAYDKPLGYAGDFYLMTVFFASQLEGHDLYTRFLHYASQHYTLGQAVVAREKNMRAMVRKTLTERAHPTRIASLACGPAMELQHVIGELEHLEHPAKLILIDQDVEALQHSHEAINHILLEEGRADLPVDLHCLHFSVRQILKPRNDAERAVGREVLSDLDLIYSAGLFDYLPESVARKLLSALYGMLRPGGRLFIGNLREAPESTWMMEYVLSWHLEYREPATMAALADHLAAEGAAVDLVHDETGHCMFLEVQKPE